MLETLAVLLIVFVVIGFIKFFGFLFQAGFFIVLLPIKILLGVIGAVVALILLPAIVIPVLITALVPLLLIGLGIAGLVYLLK
jgi:hypothetical protein